MRNLLRSLIYSFFHPFKFASYVGGGDFISWENRKEWEGMSIRPLSMAEALTLSWIFKIISGILVLIILGNGELFLIIHPMLKVTIPSKIFIIYMGLSVALFPLKIFVVVGIWKWAIRVFTALYLEEEEVEGHLDHILSHSLSSNVLLAIPFIGVIFQELLWGLYLFAGLKNTYELSSAQAASIIFLFFCFLLLIFLSLFMAFALALFSLSS